MKTSSHHARRSTGEVTLWQVRPWEDTEGWWVQLRLGEVGGHNLSRKLWRIGLWVGLEEGSGQLESLVTGVSLNWEAFLDGKVAGQAGSGEVTLSAWRSKRNWCGWIHYGQGAKLSKRKVRG